MPPIVTEPLFIAAFSLWFIQLLLNLLVYRKLIFEKRDCSLPAENPPGVSVVIAARNEAENLKAYLPDLLAQDHPDYEVIVVNDQSEDGTKYVVESFQEEYTHLKLVNIEEHIKKRAGKKFALTMGIKKAQHEIILLTDADCRPADNNWTRYMARHYADENTQFVIGFSSFEPKPNPLNAFIRYDAFQTAFYYFGLGKAGMPYMGVGRNLSYRKSLFMKNKGFAKYQHVPAGDDDLFVNTFGNKHNTAFEYCPQSFTISKPKSDLKSWFRQKHRHLSVGKYYKGSHKFVLGLLWLLNIGLYGSLAALLSLNPENYYAWGVLGLKLVTYHAFTLPVMNKLGMISLWPVAFILDVIYQTIYMLITGIYTALKKKVKGWS